MTTPKNPTTRADYEQRMLRVLVYIQNHLDETLELDDLANIAHFSPFHFHRVFRGMIGESVQAHVRRLRLERSAHRLKFTDQPVTRIAFEAGYESHEAFTRTFRAMFGQSPTGFRKQQQAIPVGPSASGVHFSPDAAVTTLPTISGGDPPLAVEVTSLEPMHVVFARHTGPYDRVGETWARLFQWAGPRGIVGPALTTFGVVHDDPAVTPPDRLRYDACIAAGEHDLPNGEIASQVVGGGRYARTRHTGPYETLGDTYARLCGEWLADSGHELRSAPAIEFYRNAPMNTPLNELITDIHMPLEN